MTEKVIAKQMTIVGIGGKWFLWSFLFSLPVIVVSILFEQSLTIESITPFLFYGAGTILIAVGLPFWFIAAVSLNKHFKNGRLCKDGVFGLCRNPIYTAWIFFLIPGVLLFFLNPLLLSIPFIMYAILRVFLPQEEVWLEEKFGEDYLAYKRQVNRLLPFRFHWKHENKDIAANR